MFSFQRISSESEITCEEYRCMAGCLELGMIPLFMAGDKHFINMHIFCENRTIKLFFFAAEIVWKRSL